MKRKEAKTGSYYIETFIRFNQKKLLSPPAIFLSETLQVKILSSMVILSTIIRYV